MPSRPRRPAALLAAVALGAGCQPGGDDSGQLSVCDAGGPPVVAVMNTLRFSRVDAEGVTRGFNLDGEVSSGAGSSGCGVEDFVDPDGGEGIDNVFGSLLPALELTEFQAVEGLIQDAINSGELLIALEMSGVEDTVDDDCVDLEVLRGAGQPMVGTDGVLLAGQTLQRDPDQPGFHVEGARIQEGVLLATPIDLDLPLQVFDVELLFALRDGALRVDFHEDGGFSGFVTGGVDADAILDIARTENVNDELVDVMEGLLGSVVDLAPDEHGECQKVSVSLEFEAVPAFLFEDE